MGHFTQVEDEVAPIAIEIFPGVHLMQNDYPSLGWYVPGWHFIHK